jgi:hypothetical protein
VKGRFSAGWIQFKLNLLNSNIGRVYERYKRCLVESLPRVCFTHKFGRKMSYL